MTTISVGLVLVSVLTGEPGMWAQESEPKITLAPGARVKVTVAKDDTGKKVLVVAHFSQGQQNFEILLGPVPADKSGRWDDPEIISRGNLEIRPATGPRLRATFMPPFAPIMLPSATATRVLLEQYIEVPRSLAETPTQARK